MSRADLAERDGLVLRVLARVIAERSGPSRAYEPWEVVVNVSDLAGRQYDSNFGKWHERPWGPEELRDLSDAQVQGSLERMEKIGLVARITKPAERYYRNKKPRTLGWTLPEHLAERERQAEMRQTASADRERRIKAVNARIEALGLPVPKERDYDEQVPTVMVALDAIESLLDRVGSA